MGRDAWDFGQKGEIFVRYVLTRGSVSPDLMWAPGADSSQTNTNWRADLQSRGPRRSLQPSVWKKPASVIGRTLARRINALPADAALKVEVKSKESFGQKQPAKPLVLVTAQRAGRSGKASDRANKSASDGKIRCPWMQHRERLKASHSATSINELFSPNNALFSSGSLWKRIPVAPERAESPRKRLFLESKQPTGLHTEMRREGVQSQRFDLQIWVKPMSDLNLSLFKELHNPVKRWITGVSPTPSRFPSRAVNQKRLLWIRNGVKEWRINVVCGWTD